MWASLHVGNFSESLRWAHICQRSSRSSWRRRIITSLPCFCCSSENLRHAPRSKHTVLLQPPQTLTFNTLSLRFSSRVYVVLCAWMSTPGTISKCSEHFPLVNNLSHCSWFGNGFKCGCALTNGWKLLGSCSHRDSPHASFFSASFLLNIYLTNWPKTHSHMPVEMYFYFMHVYISRIYRDQNLPSHSLTGSLWLNPLTLMTKPCSPSTSLYSSWATSAP